MNSLEKLDEAKRTFKGLKQYNSFHSFKTDFHSCCESLSSIFQLASSEQKKALENSFFPEVVKIIREDNFHPPSIDAFESGTTSIPSITALGGPLRIRNNGIITVNGKELPKGDLEFGTKTSDGFNNTVDGGKDDSLNEVPTIVKIKMRDLFNTKIKKKTKKLQIEYKEVNIWQTKLNNYDPISFLQDAISFYENFFENNEKNLSAKE